MINIRNVCGKDLDVTASEVFAFIGKDAENDPGIAELVNECRESVLPILTPRACFSEYEIKIDGKRLSLGFTETESEDLAKNLDGCRGMILVAATVGIAADRAVAKYKLTEPSRALVMQAVGAAAVEAWLDRLEEEFSKVHKGMRPRFSCGYGDLDLSLQRDIFAALECEKNVGITLNSSLLMTPTKSVTAIIGYEN